ncbi:hypothetical protein Tco_0649231 [Tanacetum coccineum]
MDTTLRSGNGKNTGQFVNQRTVTVVGARETVRNQAEKGVPLSANQGDWLDATDEEPDEQELEAHYLYMEKIQEIPAAESGPTFDTAQLEKVHTDDAYNVFANEQEHIDQPKNMNDTYLMEKIQEVSTAESGPTFDAEPLEKVHTDNEYNVFENDQDITDQPKNINAPPLMETIDSNTTPDSLDVCDNDFKDDQNANDQEDERVTLANLIANLKLDTDENKKIQ